MLPKDFFSKFYQRGSGLRIFEGDNIGIGHGLYKPDIISYSVSPFNEKSDTAIKSTILKPKKAKKHRKQKGKGIKAIKKRRSHKKRHLKSRSKEDLF